MGANSSSLQAIENGYNFVTIAGENKFEYVYKYVNKTMNIARRKTNNFYRDFHDQRAN